MSDDVNGTCLATNLDEFSDAVKSWATIFFFTAVVVIVLTLLIFWFKRDHLVYLRKRSFAALLLNALGQICVIIPGNGVQISSSLSNPFIYCPVWNIAILATIPLILTSILSITLSFRNRALLSKALADNPNDVSPQTWFLASGRFSAIFMLSAIAFIFTGSFIVSMFLCPDYGVSDTCQFLGVTDVLTILVSFLPSAIVLVIVIYIQQKLKTYPDPFRLLTELKHATILAVSSAFVFLILDAAEVGKLDDAEPLGFTWGRMIDYSVMSLFIWLGPLQIYKAFKFNESKAVDIEHNLDKVLSDPTGFQLLKQHLINEFSVENILFLEQVDKFKTEKNPETKRELGLDIYEQYMKFKRINISHDIYSEVDAAILQDDINDKVFDEAYDEVKMLIEFDPFLRFIKTEEFLAYAGLKQIRKESTGTGTDSKSRQLTPSYKI